MDPQRPQPRVIVIDASVVGTALIDDAPYGDRARARLHRRRLVAPALIDAEVLSLLKGLARAGTLDRRRAREAVADFATMSLRRMPHLALIRRMWELRDNVSIYDAAYVALAEAIGAPLLTADGRLARAPGVACEVELIR